MERVGCHWTDLERNELIKDDFVRLLRFFLGNLSECLIEADCAMKFL